ncbi:MAG: PleD family two-component system response regulator [Proteobacteria bacterium]|jgi:two-component system cell cycle response regulator|nr:PleD family two-component system response regulator [Alphaproteobacteria bacterium]NCC03820.1 PleD family two-component system response regulator [Pseudomonadota bacterium]
MSARILVVDDNKINVKLLAAKLAKDYYTVLTSENGPDAIAIAKKEVPDLILLDVMMPEMDGFEVCTILKNDPVTVHIPIVMVTALSDVQDRVRGLECGADDFLTKPINDTALFARVRSLLRLKRIMDEWRLREATAAQFSLPSTPETAFDENKGNILLLESDAFDCETLTRYFTKAGLQVQNTETLQEVIDQVSIPNEWDLFVVSLHVGIERCLHLCAQLRAREDMRHVPILLIGEQTDLEHISRALDIGANDYILRPIESSELMARTRTQLRQKHHYDRLRQNYEQNLALALVDPLTGAYNRRYMDMHLPMLFARCKMTQRPLSVINIDLDHFKNVNDTYGHAAGDMVLKDTLARVLVNVRPSDLVVRMGGEEFAIVMPETDLRTAINVAERLRENFEQTPVLVGDQSTKITVTSSFGVASLNHESDTTPTQLLDRCDAVLYRAKETGRNKVVGEDQGTT